MYWNTVSDLVRQALHKLMSEPIFNRFRLVGGTALSLQIGHRMSVDIDLFTDAEYGTIDFQEIDAYLRREFDYVSPDRLPVNIGFGMCYIVGSSETEALKLDVMYSNDPFVFPVREEDGIRMAGKEEIAAMKMDIIDRTGRKKDFWDVHALLDFFKLEEMIGMHRKRHVYIHNREHLRLQLVNFDHADDDFNPECLRGKHWEIVKLELAEAAEKLP